MLADVVAIIGEYDYHAAIYSTVIVNSQTLFILTIIINKSFYV